MVICKEIIFLVHSLESGFGGMESHQNAFIRYFIVKQELPIICKYVVENKGNNYKVSILYLANLYTSFLCNLIYPTFTTLSVYIN